ncbi:hypothetical protein GOARA_012_01060 [Gordonia araii NBRC 100433]|uniref:Uncharacterized protein n=1 Tax=Gordonia araii NBRC 100433 TaxID=1073574 RepID=G7GY80_9ACTN|nr:hypothetical protein [Gordonia araii]NNG98162.1 hypothetical protein [Gordonia araii NBRC 100433]GAB08555.1 hypothetical protein GOARA_012_01060 [Gordonia araii NBRC 100433]
MSAIEDRLFNIAMYYGIGDSVPIYSMYGAVKEVTGSTDHAGSLLIPIYEKLVTDKLAEVGVPGDDGFIAWPSQENEALDTVRAFLHEHPNDPNDQGFSIWFELTDHGESVAKAMPAPFPDDEN